MITNSFISQLKSIGYKLTAPRVEIIKVLSSTDPLSAQEVFELLKFKGLNVDLVTAYRTLELFKDLGFVQKVQFEDKTARYELTRENEHHHHLICIKCGEIEDVEINEQSLADQIEVKSAFKVQRHSLEFFGFCKNCQNMKLIKNINNK